MSFIEGNIFNKILAAIPSMFNPVLVKGLKNRWRDDFDGNELDSADWEILQTGSGQTVTVSASELRINAGTVANAQTIIRSKNKVTFPSRLSFIYNISQRIVNNNFIVEIVDSSGNNYARATFTGTSSVLTAIEVSNNGNNTGSINLANSSASSSYSIFEIDFSIEEIRFTTRAVDSGSVRGNTQARNRRIPDPSLEYFLQIRCMNGSTAPASASSIYFDSIAYQSIEVLPTEIVGSKGSVAGSDAITVVPALGQTFNTVGTVSSVISSDGAGYTTETTTNLAANAVYSQVRDGNGRKYLHIFVETDQAGTLFVDQGANTVSFYNFPGNSCPSGVTVVTVELKLRYYRIRYVNGDSPTTSFKIHATLKTL